MPQYVINYVIGCKWWSQKHRSDHIWEQIDEWSLLFLVRNFIATNLMVGYNYFWYEFFDDNICDKLNGYSQLFIVGNIFEIVFATNLIVGHKYFW